MDMLDPKFYVMCDHIIDVKMETQAGVEAAGYTFAKEGSAELTLVAWWPGGMGIYPALVQIMSPSGFSSWQCIVPGFSHGCNIPSQG